jgi:hypothetical protein
MNADSKKLNISRARGTVLQANAKKDSGTQKTRFEIDNVSLSDFKKALFCVETHQLDEIFGKFCLLIYSF